MGQGWWEAFVFTLNVLLVTCSIIKWYSIALMDTNSKKFNTFNFVVIHF